MSDPGKEQHHVDLARVDAARAGDVLPAALALAALGHTGELEALYGRALAAGFSLADLRAGALMTHLFAGFPRAIEAFQALARAAAAARAPAAGGEDTAVAPADRARRGTAVFDEVYGAHAARVRAQLRAFAPTFEEAVLEDAYGRILARADLALALRETMAVAALAALRLPRQLQSHARGALRAGASHVELARAAALAGAVAGPDAEALAAEAIARARESSP